MKKITFNFLALILFYVMVVITESIIQNRLVLWNDRYVHLLIIMTMTLIILSLSDKKKEK